MHQTMDDESIRTIRRRVIEIMRKTRNIELESIGVKGNTLRFYTMTKTEFEHIRNRFSFCLFLDDVPNEIEGFCYDIRTVITQRFFVFASKVCYLPLPVSKKRWEMMLQEFPSDIPKLSTMDKIEYPRLLLLPLFISEVLEIMKSLKEIPIVCSIKREVCETKKLEDVQKEISFVELFDTSLNRFYSQFEDNSTKPQSTSIVPYRDPLFRDIAKQEYPIVSSSSIEEIQDLFLIQMGSFGLKTPLIIETVNGELMRGYIKNYLERGLTKEQIVSFMIDDFLQRIVEASQTE